MVRVNCLGVPDTSGSIYAPEIPEGLTYPVYRKDTGWHTSPAHYARPLIDRQGYADRVNAKRDEVEAAGFEYNGKWFQSDPRSADRIANAALAAQTCLALSQPFSVDWAAEDNTIMALDATGMLSLQAALMQRAAEVHYRGRALKAQIWAAATQAELDAIDIENGW